MIKQLVKCAQCEWAGPEEGHVLDWEEPKMTVSRFGLALTARPTIT